MVILKKIVIMTQYNNSNCSGIVKFENFAGRTSCFVRILGLKGEGVICIKCGDDTMYCGKIFDGEKSFNAWYDLNRTLQIVVVADGSIVCTGSNKGRFSPNAIMLDIHRYFATISQTADGFVSKTQVQNQEKPDTEIVEERQESVYQEEVREQQNQQPVIEPISAGVEEQPQAKRSAKESAKAKPAPEKKKVKTETAEPFYKKIEESLAKLFEAHEKDEELTLLIPNSKWARVPVEDDGYYVVGVIENDGVPDIICYGVPDKDSSNPPQNSSDCRQWMELEKGGRGYWMMYQSAVSGVTLTTSVI